MLKYIIFDDLLIPSYNLLIATGIAMAMLFLQYQNNFRQKSEDDKFKIHLSLLISVIIGFTGAYIFDAYTQNVPLNLENLNRIGLTFFSGLICGCILLALMLKFFSLPVLQSLNTLTPSFCIAHFFGRIGCFLAGCCYGKPTSSIFGVTFPKDSLAYHHHHSFIKVHPTQLYESLFVAVLFILLYRLKPKNTFYIYLISYSLFRFFLEFIRDDSRGIALNQQIFTPSQVISIFTASAVVLLLILNKMIRTNKYSSVI